MSNDHGETADDGTTPESGDEPSPSLPDTSASGVDDLSSEDLRSDDLGADFDDDEDPTTRSESSGMGRIADEVAELQGVSIGARVPAGSARAAARASAVRTGTTATQGKGKATPIRDRPVGKGNIFARLSRYLREVVAELGKVIWPTSKEFVTYTIVVLVFLIFMVALVYGLDLLFAKGVLTIFG